MDILRELSAEELNYIIKKLEENLPYTLKDLYYIKSTLKCLEESCNRKNLSDKVLPKLYTHRHGKRENCTIFGITGESDHTVWYFTFDDSLREIRECLDTKFIMWGTKFVFETIHVEQIDPILDYAKKHELKVDVNEYAAFYTLSKREALSFNVEIPCGTLLRELKSTDAKFCNNMWVFKNEQSENWIKSLIDIHGGYALIDNKSKEILSFIFITSQYALGGLTTVEEARRKGYGEVLVKHLAKELAKRDFIPFAYVANDNQKSLNLFLKLGFQKIGGSNWIVMAAQ